MSLNVLVIPEDFRKDQDILKPIIKAMLDYLGKPQANVRICHDPRLGGVAAATDWRMVEPIIDRYQGRFQLILLLVDRDGVKERRSCLDNLEGQSVRQFPGVSFFAENAWQEVEVWALAGCVDLPGERRWGDAHANPKEAFFTVYSKSRGYAHLEHDGRWEIVQDAAKRYSRIRQLCPEDIQALEAKVQRAI